MELSAANTIEPDCKNIGSDTATMYNEPIDTPVNSLADSNVILFFLLIFVLLTFLVSFALGRYSVSLLTSINVLLGQVFQGFTLSDVTAETIILKIRLPRILAALLIGAAMALSGASYQGMFKNPMVSPDILGASAGAGFGAALAILFSSSIAAVQVCSFTSSLAAVALTIGITKLMGKDNNITLILVLSGMVVSTMFSAFISITKFVADPDNKLPAITFWLMGGLTNVNSQNVVTLAILLGAGSLPLYLVRWKLNVLSFGDEEAMALGVNVKHIRYIIILCSTLLTASCISICGQIGWIGLIIPHMARLIVGPNFKVLIPAASLLGAAFLLIVDDIARCAFASEIPLGIITAIIGAPFFLYLLMTNRKGWI
ncbi:MAG: FecCD family ABC transporter permease [Fibrobacterota bacterium]|nr:iron ABC transporter permease [Chitinispirillaceae bacterium]